MPKDRFNDKPSGRFSANVGSIVCSPSFNIHFDYYQLSSLNSGGGGILVGGCNAAKGKVVFFLMVVKIEGLYCLPDEFQPIHRVPYEQYMIL